MCVGEGLGSPQFVMTILLKQGIGLLKGCQKCYITTAWSAHGLGEKWFVSKIFIYLSFTCLCVPVHVPVCVHALARVCRSENSFQELVLSWVKLRISGFHGGFFF